MKPNMLEELWKASNNGEFDIVCCGYEKYDSNNILDFSWKPNTGEVIRGKDEVDIFHSMNPSFWAKLCRRNLFVLNDVFFQKKYFLKICLQLRVF